ncbi:helix-turn-helix transcriptional regulator [Myceligenerans salitolerans]|uniref:Response regulator transcription factor n=1 Tax=Myceligenerans salitolerans TaxID=1230528 RepID=A0ABS3IC39_9MICO|nr:LuxR C-terminal-related transcriptional regulator [Myceligenerans salitolerans]MBO0610490.1 response regulator transcription factor [Myceligenerans salitolerans]
MSTSIARPHTAEPGAGAPRFDERLFRELPFLLAAQDADLRLREEELTEARRAVEVLSKVHRPDPRRPQYEVLEVSAGIAAVGRRFRAIAESAERTCLVALPAAFRSAIGLDVIAEVQGELARRGVVTRQLHEEDAEHDAGFRQFVASAGPCTGAFRLRPHVRAFAVIADRSRFVLSTDPLDPEAGVVEAGHSGLLGSIAHLLEEQWSTARDWDEPSNREASPLTRQERDLLGLLAAGRTDEQVGHRLKVSLRTVRRTYSHLARRMAIRSRFEAGVVAARNGWV